MQPWQISCDFFFEKICNRGNLLIIFALTNAEVAQLVELQPSKLVVASSSLVFRSSKTRNIRFGFFI